MGKMKDATIEISYLLGKGGAFDDESVVIASMILKSRRGCKWNTLKKETKQKLVNKFRVKFEKRNRKQVAREFVISDSTPY